MKPPRTMLLVIHTLLMGGLLAASAIFLVYAMTNALGAADQGLAHARLKIAQWFPLAPTLGIAGAWAARKHPYVCLVFLVLPWLAVLATTLWLHTR